MNLAPYVQQMSPVFVLRRRAMALRSFSDCDYGRDIMNIPINTFNAASHCGLSTDGYVPPSALVTSERDTVQTQAGELPIQLGCTDVSLRTTDKSVQP